MSLLWFCDFLSEFHVRHHVKQWEFVNVLVPFTVSYGRFKYSDGTGGVAFPEDLARRGRQVELHTGPQRHCLFGSAQLGSEKGTCFPCAVWGTRTLAALISLSPYV